MKKLDAEELQAGLDEIRQAPADNGVLQMVVRRPDMNQREVLEAAELSTAFGLVGDNWYNRGGMPGHPQMQLTLMSSRVIQLVAGNREHWALAGDQLFVDMDLSNANLPPGTRLSLGSAVIEVTAEPHLPCVKFSMRFGKPATKFVNSPEGKECNYRGINAKVVQDGQIAVGDTVTKLS